MLGQGYCPGSEVMSRIILQDEGDIDIVVKSLVGDHASSSLYTLGRCQWANKTISDVLYLPKLQSVPPIVIEIKNKVDEGFLNRVVNYCISIKEEYSVLPVIMIISIKIRSEDFREKQAKAKLQADTIYTSFPAHFGLKNFIVYQAIPSKTINHKKNAF